MGGSGSGGWNDTGRPLKAQTTPLDVVRVWKADGFADGRAMSSTWTFSSGQNSSITQYGLENTWAFTCRIATIPEPARLSTSLKMFISSGRLAGSSASAPGGSVRSLTAVAPSFPAVRSSCPPQVPTSHLPKPARKAD